MPSVVRDGPIDEKARDDCSVLDHYAGQSLPEISLPGVAEGKGKPRAAMFNLISEDWGGYVETWVKEISCP